MKNLKFFKMMCLMISLAMIFSLSVFAVDETIIPVVFEAVEHDHDGESVHDVNIAEDIAIQTPAVFFILDRNGELITIPATASCSCTYTWGSYEYVMSHKLSGSGCTGTAQIRCAKCDVILTNTYSFEYQPCPKVNGHR